MSLDALDLFKTPFSITYNNKESFSTKVGTSTSIVFILGIFAYTCYLFSKMFSLNDPTISNLEDTTYDYFNITLNQTNHYFGIRLDYGNWDPSELSKLVKISANLLTLEGSTTYEIAPCKDVFSEGIHLDYFYYSTLAYDNTFCIKDNFNFKVGIDYEINNQINYKIDMCIKDDNNDCYDRETIIKKLKSTAFNVIGVKTYQNLYNYEKPIQFLVDGIFWDFLDTNFYKVADLYYKQLQIETNDNFIMDNSNLISSFLIDSNNIVVHSAVRDDSSSTLCDITLNTSTQRTVLKRKYTKIPEVLSQVVGLAQSIMLVFNIVVGIINSELKMLVYVNTFYDFEEDNANREETSVNNKMKKQIELNDIKLETEKQQVIEVIPSELENNQIRANLKLIGLSQAQIAKRAALKKSSVNSVSDAIRYILCPFCIVDKTVKNRRNKLLRSYSHINKIIDMFTIFKIKKELDFLKSLMLNDNQTELLNYMKKQNYSEIKFEEKEVLVVTSLNGYYQNIINKELSEMDVKILKQVDKDVLKSLEANRLSSKKN